nr:SDR family NAD(P)-dependent oxidoreductase [Cyclobacteriaceae bacterium]
MSYFNKKTVIITGSSRGIGRVLARELCRQGANVVLNGREAERLQQTYSEFL